ncbi:MAG: CcdB family protein [Steroidobacteraceae bacterium]
MAQFDVHRNPGRQADTIPYVVVVQSSQFDSYRRRVIVPLVRATVLGKVAFAAFNPAFRIGGTQVVLHPLEMVSIPVEQLGKVVGSLATEGQVIIAALDELFSRAWR